MKASSFKVIEFRNPSGETVYRVSGTKRDGTRVRRNYSTEAEATDHKQRLENEWHNLISQIALKHTKLSTDQVAEAERAFDDLGGKPLAEAVRFYLDNYREPQIRRSLKEAFKEFIGEKRQENLRQRSIQDLESRIGFLVKLAGERFVSDITEAQLRGIIHRDGRVPETRNNDRRSLSGFFGWATAKRYCEVNPMAGIAPIRFHRREPEIFSLNQVDAILDAARKYQNGAMLPYFVLAVFAAIRPQEIQRLTWRDIDLTAKQVRITGAAAKKRQRRLVELSDNAVEWLEPLALRRVPIWPTKNGRKQFEAVKKAAGFGSSKKTANDLKPFKLVPWIQDGMRHTAISCHFAQHGHEGDTARWAGNSPDEMHRSYKELVSKADAERFWNAYPDGNRVEKVDFGKSAGKSAAKSA